MTKPNHWYKNAIIYGIKLEVFKDGNGDGIGDFIGLTQKLDYLKDLGINCLWLLPFYPSSGGDAGYDVINYKAIDPQFGSFADFKEFLVQAKKRDIRVIVDLVIQHTSNQHEWFKQAIEKPTSKYHDYYVWSKKIPAGPKPVPGFPGKDNTVWRYVESLKQYYYHSFYYFEPDLNFANKDVQKEIFEVIDFWLQFPIDGFRIDAATMLFSEKNGLKKTIFKNPGKFMEKMNKHIKKKSPEAIMLAEADVSEDEIKLFFGKGGRMQLLYNFLLNRYIFLALARSDAYSIIDKLNTLPKPSADAQWVNFIRNLDELNIGKLIPEEQKDIYEKFGPREDMQIFERGLRRRTAPMLNGNIRQQKMVFSLLFSLPGAVLFVYGDEIGMGEKLELPERNSVRTIMQWDTSKNAGFSEITSKDVTQKLISSGNYSYHRVNVESALKDKESILNAVKKLCQIAKEYPEIGFGDYKVIETSLPQVLAFHYKWSGKELLILHNLASEAASVSIKEFAHKKLSNLFSDDSYEKEVMGSEIKLSGYGYRWFRVGK